MFKSLKSKFLVTFGLGIFITISIMIMVFGVSINRYFYSEVENLLVSELSLSAGIYNKYFSRESIDYKAEVILQNADLDQYADLQLIDDKNNLILSTGTKFDYTDDPYFDYRINPAQISYQTRGNNQLIIVSVPLFDNNKKFVGVVRGISIINELNYEVSSIITNAVLFGIGIFALSIALGTLFAKSIINPIKELTDATRKIADGDLDYRVEIHNEDEIGDLSNTFNYMAEEIKKSERLKTDFVSSISHELRTPLTAIKGWSETIIYDDFQHIDECTEGVNIIINETDRLSNLVEELLDFSRFQNNNMKLIPEPVDLNILLRDVEKLLSHRSNIYKFRVEFNYNDAFDSIECDYNRIKQVIINIIDNSLKHGGDDCYVKISLSIEEDYYRITFKDNGVGMSEDVIKDITKKFFKGKTNTSGSGLGLAIADEIMKLHHGHMIIKSQMDIGTTVVVDLPII